MIYVLVLRNAHTRMAVKLKAGKPRSDDRGHVNVLEKGHICTAKLFPRSNLP